MWALPAGRALTYKSEKKAERGDEVLGKTAQENKQEK